MHVCLEPMSTVYVLGLLGKHQVSHLSNHSARNSFINETKNSGRDLDFPGIIVTDACNPRLRQYMQKDHNFKATIGYILKSVLSE